MSLEDQERFKFGEMMIGIFCVVGICLVKISVGFFLRRFLQTRFLKRLVLGFIIFISIYLVYSILTFVMMCTPTRSYWDSNVSGTCWSARTLSIVGNLNAAINITTDFFTWLLPIWVIMKLQLKRKTKMTLMVIMSLGLFAVIASVLRVFLGSAWEWSTDLYIWLNVEVDTAILAASLPCLRPIFRRFLGSTNEPSYPQGPSHYGNRTAGTRSGYARQDDSIALTSVSHKGDSFKTFAKKEETYNAKVTSNTSTVSRGGVGRDNDSEEAILSPHGITKTLETTVFVSNV
ncbi:hypothetical protein M406DRAFT_66385 [Cryphonectria parasitica EP155]|uniref:Rhodopsin domain-containing protein n=1 Tax=Cryphonectria parasitica (strain ATCC 38755 / EP155) TaxID=660469 RepID=A0A9P5CUA0_CRYP1|nr:uncharacterized protein M406DRAFT_66385 [Cryphonectria parasitica EP155]KAF3769925.1 hypothetical protein M406DRAFT_66385 [Cryphonectria parasitica EP155]